MKVCLRCGAEVRDISDYERGSKEIWSCMFCGLEWCIKSGYGKGWWNKRLCERRHFPMGVLLIVKEKRLR